MIKRQDAVERSDHNGNDALRRRSGGSLRAEISFTTSYQANERQSRSNEENNDTNVANFGIDKGNL
jgi:hypothetical protein